MLSLYKLWAWLKIKDNRSFSGRSSNLRLVSSSFSTRYAGELSGGQCQVAIARAIIVKPKLIICDEPVSALDVTIQGQIMELLKDLQKEYNMAYLFISHDLGVVNYMSDEIMVMQSGKIIEVGEAEQIIKHPKHVIPLVYCLLLL